MGACSTGNGIGTPKVVAIGSCMRSVKGGAAAGCGLARGLCCLFCLIGAPSSLRGASPSCKPSLLMIARNSAASCAESKRPPNDSCHATTPVAFDLHAGLEHAAGDLDDAGEAGLRARVAREHQVGLVDEPEGIADGGSPARRHCAPAVGVIFVLWRSYLRFVMKRDATLPSQTDDHIWSVKAVIPAKKN